MAALNVHFVIYLDEPWTVPSVPHLSGIDVRVCELSPMILPSAEDELFGPYAEIFSRAKPKCSFVVSFESTAPQKTERFFQTARSVMMQLVFGRKGIGLDVLRLWPFPLEAIGKALPEELIAEDLYSVGFTSMGEHGIRAETIGFSKLGARELTFEFADRSLMDEAVHFCGHMADWLLEHGRQIVSGQTLAFGFDRLAFLAPETSSAEPFHGWHPPLVQKLLPAGHFPGVGVFEVHSVSVQQASEPREDLTLVLKRARAQSQLLEELQLRGDSPHASMSCRVQGAFVGLKSLVATRSEAATTKDSGWQFQASSSGAAVEMPLSGMVDIAPDLVRFLALPPGVKVSWGESGAVTIDCSRIKPDQLRAESEGE